MAEHAVSRRVAQRQRPSGRRLARGPGSMRGGTLLGFLIGLVTGLAIAVVVALFVTRAPVPFVNKAGRASDRVLEPRTSADAPDPNAPLYSKNPLPGPPPPAQAPEPAQAESGASILERLFGRQAEPEAPPASSGGAPIAASRPAAEVQGARPPADAPSRPQADAGGYLLQAGAFRGRDEADAMRARLALLGLEGRVQSADVNGQPLYRVRVGPFSNLDDMNAARARLADNGIEASVVRQR